MTIDQAWNDYQDARAAAGLPCEPVVLHPVPVPVGEARTGDEKDVAGW